MSRLDLKQPLHFSPVMMERVWGGNRLGNLFGKPIPEKKVIGESWELVDRPEAQSVVDSGPCAGMTLRQILEQDPDGVLGELAPAKPKQFPLLIKYVDAGTPLSVQVHPDDAGAVPFNDRGKSECWVVVHCEHDARITRGLIPGTTREVYQRAVAEDRVEDVLHSFTPKVGDVVALPAGLVHAIGSGLVVAEIQQNSDLTLRIYDYKRLGLDGKPRKLHVKEALEAIRFGDPGHEFDGNMRADTVVPLSKETKNGVAEELVLRGIYFDLLRYTVKAGAELRLPPLRSAPRCLMTIAGNGKLNNRAVKAGETMLACAAADALFYQAGSESILLVSIPKRAAC